MNKFLKLIIVFTVCVSAIYCHNIAHAASKESLVKKGNALFSSGKYDEAINTYDEAAVNDPESPYIYFNKGTALYKKEDYSGAKDAFGQAAIKTKDLFLEAKSKYNLGLCFFREGERQKDSDLKKALEAYGSSVQSFQEALTIDPEFTDAAENIEMVRLMMKNVLDQIKKQEEEAKKQQQQNQQAADKIKELIKKQKNLLQKNQSQIKSAPSSKTTKGLNRQNTGQSSQQNQDMAKSQEQLKTETQKLSEQLAKQAAPSSTASGSGSPPPVREHPSKQHLDASVGEQQSAVDQFSKDDIQKAADYQKKSLDDLNKALEALNKGPKQKGQQQQQQGQQQQKKGDQQKTGDKNKGQKEKNGKAPSSAPEKNKPQKNKPDENQQQELAGQLTDDADNILNEEKENKKQRMPFSQQGFKKVDKDW